MSRRGWLLFLTMCFIWGIPYLMIKVAVESVSVPVLIFARTAVGAAVLLPLALRGGQLAGLIRYWRPLLAFATIEIILPWWLLSDAERRVSSSMAALVIAAAPIIAVVVARIIGDGDRLTATRWAGLVLGFAGVVVLVGPDLRGGDPWAIVELLLTACGYATAPLLAARRLKDVPSLPMTAVCLTIAALVYTPAAALNWPQVMPPGRVLAALAGLALICTALAFVVFFALIREVGPTRSVIFTYINPVVAVLAGVVVLSESVTPGMLLASALILGGSVTAAGRRRSPEDEAADDLQRGLVPGAHDQEVGDRTP
ncbi:DMT family transporter [Sphaerimonospora thailandensis]|uniref:Membrane protein n=1 Tax=Sphaerimonospora thailandensis TaxID=795644 RepID=A0A8J3RDC0_9ACTN|nr:DMT family transporter [Sphaerimonospora thailandensis]GIH71772.1 membrane protein [Sphaerimonospora thailandensis]